MNLRTLPIVVLPLALPACEGQDCTLAGCSNGAFISIRTADDTIPLEGAIDIVLDLDGEVWEISCPSKDAGCEAVVDEETRLSIWPHRAQTGMAIEISADARGDMPRTFLLQVSVDGAQVIDEAGELDYETTAPNGRECGPICINSGVTFTIPQ